MEDASWDRTPLTVGDYILRPVFHDVTDEQAGRVIAFWRDRNALPQGHTGEHRVRQLVYLIEHPDEELVGVTTAYPARIPMLAGDLYFIYRMYIHPADRVPMLMARATRASRELLTARRHPDGPIGIVCMAENLKLTRRGVRRLFINSGYRFAGLNRLKQETWVFRFDTIA